MKHRIQTPASGCLYPQTASAAGAAKALLNEAKTVQKNPKLPSVKQLDFSFTRPRFRSASCSIALCRLFACYRTAGRRAMLFRRNDALKRFREDLSVCSEEPDIPSAARCALWGRLCCREIHGRALPESSASGQSAQAHGVTSAAAKRAAQKTSGKTMRRASRPDVFKRF